MKIWVVEIHREGKWRPFKMSTYFTTKKECLQRLNAMQGKNNKGFWNCYKTRIQSYERTTT